MLEKDIEKYFCDLVSAKGGKAIKGAGTGVAGFPDRIVLKPSGKVFFVELKAPGKKPRKLQVHVISWLIDMGFSVYVVDSKEAACEVIDNEF